MHDHDLIWIMDGAPTCIIDGVARVVPAPAVILLRPGQTYGVDWDGQRVSRNRYIHFTPSATVAHVPPESVWPTVVALPEHDMVRPLLRHIVRLLQDQGPDWHALAASAMAHAVGILCRGALRLADDHGEALGPMAEAVVSVLGEHWRGTGIGAGRGRTRALTTLPLARLAYAARRSPQGFCRAFRIEVGMPPLRAIVRLRLERAAQVLAEDRMGVAAVGEWCGFGDARHFSRQFHAAYGCAPKSLADAVRAGAVNPLLPASDRFAQFRAAVAARLRWHA
jgi:AraC-like DNA-binding protein